MNCTEVGPYAKLGFYCCRTENSLGLNACGVDAQWDFGPWLRLQYPSQSLSRRIWLYVAYRCSRLSHDICALIKDKVKELEQQQQHQRDDVPRRKLVVHVMVGQDADQMVRFASRCLWDVDEDSMASATYRNNSLFAVGVVFWLSN